MRAFPKTEVSKLDSTFFVKQNILWLDVVVYHSMFVRISKSAQELFGNTGRSLDGKASLGNEVRKRCSLYELHCQVWGIGEGIGVKECDDVRVAQQFYSECFALQQPNED